MQKTVLVTGCSSGIGLESALDLTRQGFRVLAACRKAEDVARMQELGLTGILLDLDDPQSVERAAAEVLALTDNRLYGLFNNAGYGVYGPLNTISRQQMEQQFSANFFGAHQLTMLLLPAMTPHGEGRIVMTSSVMGPPAPAAAPTPPVNTPSRHGPTHCAWSCVTAVSRSA